MHKYAGAPPTPHCMIFLWKMHIILTVLSELDISSWMILSWIAVNWIYSNYHLAEFDIQQCRYRSHLPSHCRRTLASHSHNKGKGWSTQLEESSHPWSRPHALDHHRPNTSPKTHKKTDHTTFRNIICNMLNMLIIHLLWMISINSNWSFWTCWFDIPCTPWGYRTMGPSWRECFWVHLLWPSRFLES